MAYEVRFTATARRDLHRIPPRILPAIVEFAYGELARQPRRVGKPLERELAETFSARRGPFGQATCPLHAAYRPVANVNGAARQAAAMRTAS
jgi:hypothetical protein